MPQANLLLNGDFEDTKLNAWKKLNNVSLWPFDSHSGQAAIILGLSTPADASLSQDINLPPPVLISDKKFIYRLQFYALGSLIQPAIFSVTMNLFNEKGEIFRRYNLYFPQDVQLQPNQYKQYTLVTNPITQDSNLRKIEVRFQKSGGEGTVLLDDITLIEERNGKAAD